MCAVVAATSGVDNMRTTRVLFLCLTFSSTQRKWTERQNLLFSTLAPGMDLVFFNRDLHT